MADREFAATSRQPRESRLRTWDHIMFEILYPTGDFETDTIATLRVMGKAGYRSAVAYADLAVQRHCLRGGSVSPGFRIRLGMVKRAVARGLGPAKGG
eukprot:7816114-Alexandrium_andersonii.AAC.1